MIEIYHNKGIHNSKIGYTLPHLAKIRSQNQQAQNSVLLLKRTKTCWRNYEKIWLVTVHSLYIWNSSGWNFWTKVNESVQVCQMPVSFIPTHCVRQCLLVYTQDRCLRVRPSASHHAKTNRVFFSRIWSCYIFYDFDRTVKLRLMFHIGWQKKADCFSVNGFYNFCNPVSEAMGFYYHYGLCQEARPFLSDSDIENGVKKRVQGEIRRYYIPHKGYQIVEIRECEWWCPYETDATVKSLLFERFPYKRPLSDEQL